MIPLEEARAFILERCRVLETEELPLAGTLGHVNAHPIVATEDVPPFANSAMDGYALRSCDVVAAPVELLVADSVMAGDGRSVSFAPGEAIRIMTGAPLPEGADAVCMVEQTSSRDDGRRVVIKGAVSPGTAVRAPGSDIAAGAEVLAAGTEITPAHLGVLARLGFEKLAVHRSPTVGIISTGDELREGAAPLQRGAIRDGNRPMLLGLVEQAGYRVVDLGIIPDDPPALRQAFETAATHCDVVVTSGGVSVGDLDIVRMVLGEICGPSMQWMQVAIKPAKPLAFGVIEGMIPIVGLPGNPVSAMVSFELFARPALRLMAGHTALIRPTLGALADVDFSRHPDGKVHFVRVRATVDQSGQLHVRPSGGQDSHQLLAMADANALAVLPDGHGVRAGEQLVVLLLEGDRLVAAPERP